MNEKIVIHEFTQGHPFVIPLTGCSLNELIRTITDILKRSDLISPAVQLRSAHAEDFHAYLLGQGFVLDENELVYEMDLGNYKHSKSLGSLGAEYQYKNYDNCGLEPFLEVTGQVSQIRRLKTREGLENLKGKDFNPHLWEILYLAEKPIGMILCNVDQISKIGSVHYIAVVDDLQGKGLGKKLHARALALLKEHGAVKYRGGTSSDNKAMLTVFSSNGCAHVDTSYIYVKNQAP